MFKSSSTKYIISAVIFLFLLLIRPAAAESIVISRVTTDLSKSVPSQATVVISWYTNVETTGRINYGLSTSYNAYIGSSASPSLYHEITLGNLKGESVYHFEIVATGRDGLSVVSNDQTFKTNKATDYDAPEVSHLKLIHVGATYIVAQWQSDELSDSIIVYDVSDTFNKAKRANGNNKTLDNEVVVKGLKKGTMYYYRAVSRDKDKNEGSSDVFSFITPPDESVDKANPIISEVSPVTSLDQLVGSDSIIFRWKTNKPAKGYVEVKIPNKSGKRYSEPNKYFSEHEVVVSGLKPNTLYWYRITTTDALGKRSYTEGATVATKPVGLVLSQAPLGQGPIGCDTEYGIYCRDLKSEQQLAGQLSTFIKNFYNNRVPRISTGNWFTLIKSYVYGGYPLQAITQAIKFGGRTVHPTIPYSVWKNTSDYQNYINK